MDATGLRRAFTSFFAERGHAVVPSSGLIPHHPKAPLFTNAGMNQFLPYILGEEVPPHRRVTSVQKCVRIRGKHDDIELIGRTSRHHTFFEMLGNWSFGEYFKEGAISFAWELITGQLGLDGDRLWVTVHHTDDEAAAIWHDSIGLPSERIEAMGADNFWEMGDTGPCGPSSEIYYDRGPGLGTGSSPATDDGERFVEFWNLVFMQYDRQGDGRLIDLPQRNIDTGAGLERLLSILQGVGSNWETDVLRPIIAEAESLSGRTYGRDPEVDVALRILADHARSMTFLVNDGVFPSNEDRGYVLRRLIRRAVRQAYQLGVEQPVTPRLVHAVVDVMGEAYPDLRRNDDFVTGVAAREEERFRATLRSGLTMLDTALAAGATVPGEVAFRLHDTHGFPIELTRELAAERGLEVDEEGFRAAMAHQVEQSKQAAKGDTAAGAHLDTYRELLEQFGTTEFVGYTDDRATARVLAVLPVDAAEGSGPAGPADPAAPRGPADSASPGGHAGQGGTTHPDPTGRPQIEIFLDRSPFYAEGGGQVGDTGLIETATGRAEVLDTTAALPGLHRHLAVVHGTIDQGQEAEASIDRDRRDAIRRNHTGTHLLHWALRRVLGTHVKQAGSLVAPDRLRFDFSHYSPVTPAQLDEIEDLVNDRILADEPVTATEMPKSEAERLGAIAFFGDKYGDTVRVLRAGERSTELCGGTHVSALGMIGPFRVTSEGSIGSNLRRIFATTGTGTLDHLRRLDDEVDHAADLLRTTPDDLIGTLDRRLAELKAAQDEVKSLRRAALSDMAGKLATEAVADGGAVVARLDGLDQGQLRELAAEVRSTSGVRAVVLGGSPGTGKVSLVAAVAPGSEIVASDLIADAARLVGGGGGRSPELAMAGGREPQRLDEALSLVRLKLGLAPS